MVLGPHTHDTVPVAHIADALYVVRYNRRLSWLYHNVMFISSSGHSQCSTLLLNGHLLFVNCNDFSVNDSWRSPDDPKKTARYIYQKKN